MNARQEFDLIPKPAVILASLVSGAVCIGCVCLLAFANVRIPEAAFMLLAGFLAAFFAAATILAAGYVYGDARRRGMPPGMWTLLVLLVPNLIGFVLYFLLRKPLLSECGHCHNGIDPGSAFCPRCGAAQGVSMARA